jgi:TetR/AcrR family transcriptional repressor of nem operon
MKTAGSPTEASTSTSDHDELIAEAAERAFDDSRRSMAKAIDGADDPLAAVVDSYLSAEHRDNLASGCGVVGLGADAARADARVRGAYPSWCGSTSTSSSG